MPLVGLELALPNETWAVASDADKFGNEPFHQERVFGGAVVVTLILEANAVRRIGDDGFDVM